MKKVNRMPLVVLVVSASILVITLIAVSLLFPKPNGE